MGDLLKLTATEASSALEAGDISRLSWTTTYLDAAEATKTLNNYVAMSADRALAMAYKVIKDVLRARQVFFEGLPVGVKDLFCTAGVETTACSAILKGFVPTYESTVTSKLWAEGGVMLGKLNCDEFAMGSANEAV